MGSAKYLIVNADDFGLSPGVNQGVIVAHERGIVTSASLMVRFPAAAEAVESVQHGVRLSLGLHVDLGEWAYRDGDWTPIYEVLPLANPARLADEIHRQFDAFCDLVGEPPTHIDSHQHVHRDPQVCATLEPMADRLGVPLRHFCPEVRYCGDFYGQDQFGESTTQWVSSAALVKILSSLPSGITELACHPAMACDFDGMYAAERLMELKSLCDPAVQAAVADHEITLCSFDQVRSIST